MLKNKVIRITLVAITAQQHRLIDLLRFAICFIYIHTVVAKNWAERLLDTFWHVLCSLLSGYMVVFLSFRSHLYHRHAATAPMYGTVSGKLQTTLQSHAGWQGDHLIIWSCRRRWLVFHPAAAAASRLLTTQFAASYAERPHPPPPPLLPPPVSAALTRCRGTLHNQ